MDIDVYNDIVEGAKDYFNTLQLGKSVKPAFVRSTPSKPTYPLVVVSERNFPTTIQNIRQTVDLMSYTFDAYAKDGGGRTAQDNARIIAKHIDEYARFCLGLRRTTTNQFGNQGTNGDLYLVTSTYTGNYFEQKQSFY